MGLLALFFAAAPKTAASWNILQTAIHKQKEETKCILRLKPNKKLFDPNVIEHNAIYHFIQFPQNQSIANV